MTYTSLLAAVLVGTKSSSSSSLAKSSLDVRRFLVDLWIGLKRCWARVVGRVALTEEAGEAVPAFEMLLFFLVAGPGFGTLSDNSPPLR